MVWLFTESIGKISIIAKGAKKAKSKILPSTLTFCFGEYVIFKGKSMYSLNECNIVDSFQGFLNDLDTLTYCSYLNELIDISMAEGDVNRELFKDLVSTFYFIKNKICDIELLVRAFEVKLLKATGYELNLEQCCICRKKINVSEYINLQYYGGVCNDCEKNNGIKVSKVAYNVLNYLKKITIDKVHRINMSEEVKKELSDILSLIIAQNYARKPKSLEIFNLLKRRG